MLKRSKISSSASNLKKHNNCQNFVASNQSADEQNDSNNQEIVPSQKVVKVSPKQPQQKVDPIVVAKPK